MAGLCYTIATGAGALADAAAAGGFDYAGLEVSLRSGPVGWYVQLGGNV